MKLTDAIAALVRRVLRLFVKPAKVDTSAADKAFADASKRASTREKSRRIYPLTRWRARRAIRRRRYVSGSQWTGDSRVIKLCPGGRHAWLLMPWGVCRKPIHDEPPARFYHAPAKS